MCFLLYHCIKYKKQVSVERVEQYTKIQGEADRHTNADKDVDPDWPTGGEIDLMDVKLRYRPNLPLVLKGLNLHIPARSKIGVVGRTGAGKSTIMVALFRIVELDSGSIKIDGVDHSTIGLAKFYLDYGYFDLTKTDSLSLGTCLGWLPV